MCRLQVPNIDATFTIYRFHYAAIVLLVDNLPIGQSRMHRIMFNIYSILNFITLAHNIYRISPQECKSILELIRNNPDTLLNNLTLPECHQYPHNQQYRDQEIMHHRTIFLRKPNIIIDKVQYKYKHPPWYIVHLALFL